MAGACGAVNAEGALGWVQPIADKPGHYSGNDTEVYGSGAYLLAGCELRKWVIRQDHPRRKTVSVTNPLNVFRPRETVSVPWNPGKGRDSSRLRVFDVRNGCVIVHQLADTDGDGRMDTLLFQSNFRAERPAISGFWRIPPWMPLLWKGCASVVMCRSGWTILRGKTTVRPTVFTVRQFPGLRRRGRGLFPAERTYGARRQGCL